MSPHQTSRSNVHSDFLLRRHSLPMSSSEAGHLPFTAEVSRREERLPLVPGLKRTILLQCWQTMSGSGKQPKAILFPKRISVLASGPYVELLQPSWKCTEILSSSLPFFSMFVTIVYRDGVPFHLSYCLQSSVQTKQHMVDTVRAPFQGRNVMLVEAHR